MADTRVPPLLFAVCCVLSACLTTTGCSTFRAEPPSEIEQRTADYGPPPSNYHDRVVRLVRNLYADHGVVHVETTEPKRAWYGRSGGLASDREIHFGWQVAFRGARLGFVQLDDYVVNGAVFFRDDRIEAIADDGEFRFLDPERTRDFNRRP